MSAPRAWLERLRGAHPDHVDIARGMAWVVLFVMVGKVAGAAKEMAVAWRFGVSQEVDAYLFINNLVSWPISVWLSMLTVVLVPLVASVRRETPGEVRRFQGELLGLTMLAGLLLSAAAFVALPILFRSGVTGLPADTVAIALRMVPAMAPLLLLGMVVNFLSAWMITAGRHANTLLEGVPALVLLLALVWFPGAGGGVLAWGTLAGFACQVLFLGGLLGRQGELVSPRFSRAAPAWRSFWKGFGIMLGGQALMSFVSVVDQFFAARLDTGAIATISYANRILALIVGLGATAVTRSTLPVFSRAQAEGGAGADRIAGHWVRLLFGAGAVATAFGWILAPWVVRLLFQRGAFTAANTLAVADALRYGLLQLPFYSASLVLVALVVSQRRYGVILAAGVLNLAAKVVANALTIPVLGLRGLMLSTSIMLAVSLVFMSVAVRPRSGAAA